jgi:hypothetical protein
MVRLIGKVATIMAAALLGATLLAVTAVAAVPTLRHIASGWWNSPDGLPALPESPQQKYQVHYEAGGLAHARTVARLMPSALVRVEAIHGRPFAHPVTVGVYVSPDTYASANGLGSRSAVGVTFLRRVVLSPALFGRQRARLEAILTHELCHAHLQSWMSQLAYLELPNWFKEGLAVMVSGGGGAEAVSEAQAREAILRGDHIAIRGEGALLDFVTIRMEQQPVMPDTAFRIEMAYRQAGMFTAFLHDQNPGAFARMLNAILDARPFREAVQTTYGADVNALWEGFVEGLKTR